MNDKPRRDLADMIFTLLVLGVSMYPLYRDDIARLRLRAEAWLSHRDETSEALTQVQREISLMEHGQ